MSIRVLLCVLGLTLACGFARCADPKPDPAAVEFFEKKVRPVLVERCYECHSTVKKHRADLFLDSRAGMLKGGDNGPALVPGDPDKSLLIKAIRYAERPKMPPRSKLSDQEIADLTAWVKMGAPWPGGDRPVASAEKFDFEKRRKHWSFRPVQAQMTPPAVKDNRWARNPLDNFILAKLEARGLSPATLADRRTILRRVTFDLTGLPPTAEEIDHFLSDSSPTPTKKWSSGCWRRRPTASAGAGTGSMSCAMRSRKALNTIAFVPEPGDIAIMSSRHSTTISPSISSCWSSWRATR